MTGNGTRITPEVKAAMIREVLDEYQSMEDVARRYNVAGSSVSRIVAVERNGRRERAAALKEAQNSPVSSKEVIELRQKNVVLKTAFEAIRTILVEAENYLDE